MLKLLGEDLAFIIWSSELVLVIFHLLSGHWDSPVSTWELVNVPGGGGEGELPTGYDGSTPALR